MPFPSIGGPELVVILIIALIILGPGKLPDAGKALGKSVAEFRRAVSDVKDATSVEPTPSSGTPAATAPAKPAADPAASDLAAPATAPAPTGDASPNPSA